MKHNTRMKASSTTTQAVLKIFELAGSILSYILPAFMKLYIFVNMRKSKMHRMKFIYFFFFKPDMVNEQLSTLYLELEGIYNSLKLEDSSSSGEEGTSNKVSSHLLFIPLSTYTRMMYCQVWAKSCRTFTQPINRCTSEENEILRLFLSYQHFL